MEVADSFAQPRIAIKVDHVGLDDFEYFLVVHTGELFDVIGLLLMDYFT